MGKYDISMQCAEIGLLPAVRKAKPSTLIIANGFSCKTQLEQSGLGRQALHAGEVLRIAQKNEAPALHARFPERLRCSKPLPPISVRLARAAGIIGFSGAVFHAARALAKRR